MCIYQELPIVSKLDPAIYGPPESLITPELIEREIKGAMTAQEVPLIGLIYDILTFIILIQASSTSLLD
jgi:hypothetical protein